MSNYICLLCYRQRLGMGLSQTCSMYLGGPFWFWLRLFALPLWAQSFKGPVFLACPGAVPKCWSAPTPQYTVSVDHRCNQQ